MIQNLKLVIWDLDDTFWRGTLSEGDVCPIESNLRLVRALTDRGVMNAICSKNDAAPALRRLEEMGVRDNFVFPSIDWSPKGQRVAGLIRDMGLRSINCLFVDDNTVNLNEAKYYSPELQIGEPVILEELHQWVNDTPITDAGHKRLHQYQVLEQKQQAKASAGDNLAFLYESQTQVSLHTDCTNVADRLFEMVHRTNQLNFTKLRSSREEFDALLADRDAQCGYVTVKDKFGDYGIVGFYAVKDGRLLHFLFSCRTIGQGVEQWVYSMLDCPELTVVGEVVNGVEKTDAPKWINQKSSDELSVPERLTAKNSAAKIVFKGGCDLKSMCDYLLSDYVIREFTYIGRVRGNNIENTYHTTNLLSLPFMDKAERRRYLDEYVFADEEMFDTHVYDSDLSILFIGTMIEPNLGVYRHNETGRRIAFCEYSHPLTDPAEWQAYMDGSIFNADNHFTREWLAHFAETHAFLGPLTPEQILDEYKQVFAKMGARTRLCLLLGSETPFLKEPKKHYLGREKVYRRVNELLRQWASEEPRVLLIDFNNYIHGQEDFHDNINHFQRRVYYQAAEQANRYISELTGEKLETKGKLYLRFREFVEQWSETGFYQTRFWHYMRIPYVWLRERL